MSSDSSFVNDDGSVADDVAGTPASSLDEAFADDDGVLYDDEVTPEYGILGFTLREILIVGAWLVAFIASFFPYLGDAPIWGTGIRWILPIGIPTVAVFLVILRRFSPDGIRRVGSLGIDQFASVAFSVAAVYWVSELWNLIAFVIAFGGGGLAWNGIVQLIAMLALVVFTVFAPLIPGLKEDFHGRLVTLAHRNANPVRPVIARPRPEPELAPEPRDEQPATDATTSSALPVIDTFESGSTAQASATTPAAFSPSDSVTQQEPAPEPGAEEAAPQSLRRSQEPPTSAVGDALDVELSGEHATDEVARLDAAEQVPLASHASGGGTGTEYVGAEHAGAEQFGSEHFGTEQTDGDEEYVPTSRRSSWNQEPEIVSDTGSIESLLGATAQDVDATETTAFPAFDQPEAETASARSSAGADAQPFWILAPTERDVHDERGEPLFRIGPTAWALVIEDRGGAYVVRHDDGRIGYLHDIADITKG